MSTKLTQKPIQFDSTIPVTEEHAEGSLHLGWRILISLILLFLVALLGLLLQSPRVASAAPVERPPAQSIADKLVLAFYYTWFDEATWTYDRLSDLPAELYVSRDRGVMGRHIDQAKGAGIDAFVVAWYGPGGESNQTEPNLAALLDEAAARGFKIAVLFETDSPFLGGAGATTGALQHLLGAHANHPAYLRVDGRPVVFFWRPTLYGVATWADIRNQVDPNRSALWVGEGVDTSYLSVFDGHHLYSNTWNPPADLTATNQKFGLRVDTMRTSLGADRVWVATVMPGYNDLKIRPGSGFAKDREDGAYYERAWQAAIDSNPRWVVINSFNEWPEGSYIEPSAAFGDRFLGLTATWSSRFKAGSTPIAAPITTEVLESDSPTAVVRTAVLNLRSGPGVSYALVGRVVGGNQLPIVGRSTDAAWWQVTAAGSDAWVFGELVQPIGPLDQVPAVDAPTPVAEMLAETVADGDPGAASSQSSGAARAEASGFTITVGGQSFTLRQTNTTAP